MKEYVKKVFCFAFIEQLAFLFFHYISFFNNGEVGVGFSFDGWVLIGIAVSVVHSCFYVGIIKLASLKLDKFIYSSKKFIIYAAFILACFEGFSVLFFNLVSDKVNAGVVYLICSIYFLILVLILYYLWRYRLELAVSMFIMNNIIYRTKLGWTKKEDFLDRLLSDYLIFGNFNNFFKGLILLTMLVLVVGIAIFLRKKRLYDYRSRQEKWREKMKQGYYSRYKD